MDEERGAQGYPELILKSRRLLNSYRDAHSLPLTRHPSPAFPVVIFL